MSDNQIIIQPDDRLDLAVEIERQVLVGGNVTRQGTPGGGNIPLFNQPNPFASYTDNAGLGFYKKTGGSNTNYDAEIATVVPFNKQQRGGIRGGIYGLQGYPQHFLVGLKDNLGRMYFAQMYNYPPSDKWFADLYKPSGAIFTNREIRNFDSWEIVNNEGIVQYYWLTLGQRILMWEEGTEGATSFTAVLNAYKVNSNIARVFYWTETKVTNLTTNDLTFVFAPNQGIEGRIVDAQRYGVKGTVAGNYALKISHPDIEENKILPVVVAPLYFRPKDVERQCGDYALMGEIVEFETNAPGGELSASDGTVLSGLKWQAPFALGWVNISYSIGNQTVACGFHVVPKLGVTGVVDNMALPIMQGEVTRFVATTPDAYFYSPSHPDIITRRGFLTAPVDATNDKFGAKDVIVIVEGDGQVYQFVVPILPMFPLPQFGGAIPIEFKPLGKDRLPVDATTSGGARQVKNNAVRPVRRWNVLYNNLISGYDDTEICDVSEYNGFNPYLATAKRLDEFEDLIEGQQGYFSLYDYHTGEAYRACQLTAYTPNHRTFQTEQQRNLSIIYTPSLAMNLPPLNFTVTPTGEDRNAAISDNENALVLQPEQIFRETIQTYEEIPAEPFILKGSTDAK